jgi:hypothetical protein
MVHSSTVETHTSPKELKLLSNKLQDQLEWLASNPHATVNGVVYVLDYGEGFGLELTPWGTKESCPVFVWRAAADLDYTAPPHVADAAFEALALADIAERAERIAGWAQS